MFDWNDEELASIGWGEGGESDDHIVPYREASEDLHNKKEWNEETSATKLIEQKRKEAKTDFPGRKFGSSSKLDIIEGQSTSEYETNSWPDLSLSSAAKTDQGSLEETTQLAKVVEIFRSTQEGKDQGDFVDYAWANIGSFDDLYQIFSNDEPSFGHVSLESSDVLWSSKDANNSTVSTFLEAQSPASALRNRSEPLEIKADYVQHNVGYVSGRIIPTEKEQQDMVMVGRTASVTSALAAENVVTANGLVEKDFGQKNQLKTQKNSQGKQEGKIFQEFYDSWSSSTTTLGQFQNQLVPSVIQSSPCSILGQKLEGPETLYQDMMITYVTSPVYRNLHNTYPSRSMLPQAQSGTLMRQPLLSGYEVSLDTMNPVKKSVDSVKPPTMTLQEKIEKLRRRQQMQAMLAIQKQQQKLGHQVPSNNKSMTQKCVKEMQSQLCDGAVPEIDDLKSLPALDLPTEQDDSTTISLAIDDHFIEDTILYMLQDIISSKLDIKIRLCIRDSLFRLAQRAMQRNCASDTSSTNNSSGEELVARKEGKSQNRIADVETETNPIDRTVAHLLFHKPLELTRNYCDKLDSPISAKKQCESKAANLENFPTRCLPDEDLKSNQQFSQEGLKNSDSLFETQPEDHFRNGHCIHTSKNASNNEPADEEKCSPGTGGCLDHTRGKC